MITVTVLAFDYALGSALLGMNDLLTIANGQRSEHLRDDTTRQFSIRLATWGGRPIKTLNNLQLTPHCAIEEIEHTDVYLVPTISGHIERTLAANPALIDLLRSAGTGPGLIGSNSTGSFFLAEAGLLNDRVATTHWSATDQFRERYPRVRLKPEQLITHDGNLLCDGGGVAWFDMGLYLVELFLDHETAARTARYFVIDTGRSAQLTYSPLIVKKYHNDHAIRDIQHWMEANYQRPIALDTLGEQFGLSQRSLIRRFKQACDSTPSQYLQDLRLDAATKLLLQTNKTIAEITHRVGYEDISSFTRLFKKKTGIPPGSYRAKFTPFTE